MMMLVFADIDAFFAVVELFECYIPTLTLSVVLPTQKEQLN